MVDILHRVGALAPLEKVYEAVATPQGVASWWTKDTTGEGTVGSTMITTFNDAAGKRLGAFELEITELDPAGSVGWLVTGGPDEWIGTHIHFDLKEEDGFTIVLFGHTGWKEPVEFMNHCSTKWATFLMSLKRFVETGTGEPSPQDVQISNWH